MNSETKDNLQQHENICGAKTRSGKPCTTPPVKGKKRCRIHGGAKGSGAPLGNQNSLKHGYYSKANIAKRKETHQLIREYRRLCKELSEL